MLRQRNSTSPKTKRLTILHYWNNGHRSSATIARLAKILVRTVKYNIAKIKEQGTIENRHSSGRPRNLAAGADKALDQWIRRDNGERTGAKTASEPRSARGPMDGTATAQTNGLQEYFASCDAYVDTETERCACPVGNSTQGRRLELNNIHRRSLLPII